MKPLPQSQAALVIRTDFSDHQAWEAIGAAILQLTEEGFGARVEFVDDAAYRGVTKEQLLDLVPEGDERPFFLMIVDEVTVRSPEHPVLVVDLRHELDARPSCGLVVRSSLAGGQRMAGAAPGHHLPAEPPAQPAEQQHHRPAGVVLDGVVEHAGVRRRWRQPAAAAPPAVARSRWAASSPRTSTGSSRSADSARAGSTRRRAGGGPRARPR
jgi:hypothetical protein